MKALTKTSPALSAVPVRPSALAAMASRFSMDPANLLNTLKNTVFKNATNEQLAALVVVANEHHLNPFTREIYAFPDKSGGIQAVIGVDGWIRIITTNEAFDGMEFDYSEDGESCTCIMHVKGRTFPVKVTEYLSECRRNTDPWKTYPRRMLRHKALIQAGRIAFGLGSLKDEDDVIVHPSSASVAVDASALFTKREAPVEIPVQVAPSEDDVPMDYPTSNTPKQGNADSGNDAGRGESGQNTQGREPALPSGAETPEKSPMQELAEFLTASGVSLDEFRRWLVSSGRMASSKAISIQGWDDIPGEMAAEILKSGAAKKCAQLFGKK